MKTKTTAEEAVKIRAEIDEALKENNEIMGNLGKNLRELFSGKNFYFVDKPRVCVSHDKATVFIWSSCKLVYTFTAISDRVEDGDSLTGKHHLYVPEELKKEIFMIKSIIQDNQKLFSDAISKRTECMRKEKEILDGIKQKYKK